MEDQYNSNSQDFREAEDTLSLRDLPIHEHDYEHDGSTLQSSPRTSSSGQDLFEFFGSSSSNSKSPNKNIIFCGKVIPYESSFSDDTREEEELNEYQKRDYLSLVRSVSFHRHLDDDRNRFVAKTRSNSVRFSSSESHQPKCSASHIQKVNITSLTSMSSTSRRRMFMFGPVKFKPEMELSTIRERQSRRAPAPMFPALGGGEMVRSGGGTGGKGQWRLLKTLRGRSHLANLLARSFGCISVPVV